MNDDGDFDDDLDETICTPEEVRAIASEAINFSGLPEQSRKLYEKAYYSFEEWKQSKNVPLTSFSETTVIAYFKHLSEKYAPPTLWSRYSMLRATIDHFNDIKISEYVKLKQFIKRKNVGYVKKKAKVFTAEQISRFLNEAPDEIYLDQKVVMIFGIDGALRSGDELTNVRMQHIERQGSMLLVKIPKTKNKIPRSFVIHKDHAEIVRKYEALRPASITTDRFFLNYQKGRCTHQVIGRNKFSKMPMQAATYLNLPDPKSYTGHSYRRTAATLLANAKVGVLAIKKLGGWKSSTVEEYVDNTLEQQINTGQIMASTIKNASTSFSRDQDDDLFAPLNTMKSSFQAKSSVTSLVTSNMTNTITLRNSEQQKLTPAVSRPTSTEIFLNNDDDLDKYVIEESSPPNNLLGNQRNSGSVFNFHNCTVTIVNKNE